MGRPFFILFSCKRVDIYDDFPAFFISCSVFLIIWSIAGSSSMLGLKGIKRWEKVEPICQVPEPNQLMTSWPRYYPFTPV